MRVTTRAGVVGGAFAAGLAIPVTGKGAARALADSSSPNTSSDPSSSVAASAAMSSDPSGPEPSGSGSPKTPAERPGALFDGTPPKPNSTTRTGKGRQHAAEPDAATPRASAP